MMTPIPDRILWCYGEYQTLYGTVDGVDFQQGLPDLDTLDPREKHLIRSRDYTGKWMDPRHEMIGIVSVWNVKCVRIVGFQNIIGFFFITP
jgi:hypothetical protein